MMTSTMPAKELKKADLSKMPDTSNVIVVIHRIKAINKAIDKGQLKFVVPKGYRLVKEWDWKGK